MKAAAFRLKAGLRTIFEGAFKSHCGARKRWKAPRAVSDKPPACRGFWEWPFAKANDKPGACRTFSEGSALDSQSINESVTS
jgi:hypothetical protein